MKNKILKTITGINLLIFLGSASMMDSESNIPAFALLASMAWLWLFAYANGGMKNVD